MGSLTLRRRSDSFHASSTETIRAPARSYCSSGKALPSPAVVSTRTSWPRWISSRAPAGVSATRYSSVLISFATPTLKARRHYLAAQVQAWRSGGRIIAPGRRRQLRGASALGRPEVQQQTGERLRILDL